MNFLILLLCITLIISTFRVCFPSSSIESVIFLIFTFIIASILQFILGVDFLGIVLIIIYVGAVAVLFLFIIMMLDTKKMEKINQISISTTNFFVVLIFVLPFFFTAIYFPYFNFFVEIIPSPTNNYPRIELMDNIQFLGYTLYTDFLICVIISGYILLVALIGPIVLTQKFDSNTKKQILVKQLSRKNTFLSFFK